jgi:TusA-related sulfurtransferase
MIKRIDCKNLSCPEPVLKTKDALEKMEEGVLEVEVNSYSSLQNIRNFAHKHGYFTNIKKEGGSEVIRIIKACRCELDSFTEEMKSKSFWMLIGGAVITAFLASTCCLGPLLFLMFGVSLGSLSFLNFFAPYHVYFNVAASGIIMYLWFNYFFKIRKRPVCDGSVCKNYLKYLSIGTVFVTVLLTYPYWAQFFVGE